MALDRSGWLDRPLPLAVLLLLPTLLLVFGVLLYPMGRAFWMSLTDLHLARPQSGVFVGLQNYVAALRDAGFLAALGRTLYFALLTVPVETALGLLIALLLNQSFPGRGFVRGLIILPWALPYVVNGVMWKWILNANYGALNALLSQLGLIDAYQIWLGHPSSAFHFVVLANIWKETPVAVILLLAALQTVPDELHEAATVDGAGALRRLWYVTLPLLRPVVAVTLVVKTVWALKEFDLIYVMTAGGPADATNLATFFTYLTTFKFMRFGYGSALAFLIALVSLVIALFHVRLVSPGEARSDGGTP
ncbi:ABC transporter permease [Limnochorda pilosa]|uniref:ABC transporter permease n=1 Tax=Limnochorda pilosa TaxID=1555112 RepID=A0A0K2SLA8_LIMPI|nr:ABC transporter permease [Limnochorda pilosa]